MTTITFLTQESCGLCDQAKHVLARVAAEADLDIAEVSLDTQEGRQLALEHAVLFAPGVLIDGKKFSHGRLSERKLRRKLQRRGAAEPRARQRPS